MACARFSRARPIIRFLRGSAVRIGAIGPVAETLTRNILHYVAGWKPVSARTAVYVGEPAGKRHLESAGFVVGNYDGGNLSADQVLVIGPGGGRELAEDKAAIANWVQAGG